VNDRDAVIVSAVRTPWGVFGGSLKDIPAVQLGAHAIREAVRRAGLQAHPQDVDNVFMGMVVQAGAGQIPSRQASMGAGLPDSVPSDTINKVCASSLRAANLGDALIRAGDAEIVVAGGMESMSQGPYLVRQARWGARMGDVNMIDSVVFDGLTCSFGGCHMGVYGSQVAKEFGVGREEQDEWALRSHLRAQAAWDAGKFAEEVAPFPVPQRKGDPVPFARDEAIRPDSSLEKLGKLKPVFVADGTVTAGNAPGLNDGGSAMVLMSRRKARELGLEPLATMVSQGQYSEAPAYLHTVPARSGLKALQKAGLKVSDLSLVEFNEAFAAVALVSTRLMEGLDPEKVNVDGGAVALGHPVGASGARILMHLVYELRRRGGGYGLAAICSGGGQGEATLIRV